MTAAPLRAFAVRHVGFEHLGSFGPALASRNIAVTLADAGVDALDQGPEHPELLIILGGPIGATDEALYPYLKDELRLIERQIHAGRPVLGICLGAQMIARVLGADVYPASAKEIGWAPIEPSEAGKSSCLSPLAENHWQVLHWHGDTFDLPEGGVRLASTDITPNQAFNVGTTILGIQFHIEVMASHIEQWLIGHTVEIAGAPGVEVERIRQETARWGPGLGHVGPACLDLWLDDALESVL